MIPRHKNDLENNDDIYSMIDAYDEKLIEAYRGEEWIDEELAEMAMEYRKKIQDTEIGKA